MGCEGYTAIARVYDKLNAEIDAFLADYVERVKVSMGQTKSKEEVKTEIAQNKGANYLRDSAIYELVIDFLAENNTIDWDAAKAPEKK